MGGATVLDMKQGTPCKCGRKGASHQRRYGRFHLLPVALLASGEDRGDAPLSVPQLVTAMHELLYVVIASRLPTHRHYRMPT